MVEQSNKEEPGLVQGSSLTSAIYEWTLTPLKRLRPDYPQIQRIMFNPSYPEDGCRRERAAEDKKRWRTTFDTLTLSWELYYNHLKTIVAIRAIDTLKFVNYLSLLRFLRLSLQTISVDEVSSSRFRMYFWYDDMAHLPYPPD